MANGGVAFDTLNGGAVPIGQGPFKLPLGPKFHVSGAVRSTGCVPMTALAASDLTVTVRLQAKRAPQTRVTVRGTPDPRFPNAIGALADIDVDPADWRDGKATATTRVGRGVLPHFVAAHHLVWRWTMRRDGVDEDLGTSESVLFVTIAPPTFPWAATNAAGGPEAPPFDGALDRACGWAAGTIRPGDAVTKIVKSIFGLGRPGANVGLTYSADADDYVDVHLAKPWWLKIELFLKQTAIASPPEQYRISCVGLAAAVTSLANLLGCSVKPLLVSRQSDQRESFNVNVIDPLGKGSTLSGASFKYHRVSIQRGSSPGFKDVLVYDAAFRVDSDANPAAPEHVFVLPEGIPLGAPDTPPGTGFFLPQLVDAGHIGSAVATTDEHVLIRRPPRYDRVDDRFLGLFVQYLLDLAVLPLPGGNAAGARTLSFPDYDSTDPEPGILIPRDILPRLPQGMRTTLTSRSAPRRVLAVDMWTDDDPRVTLSFMAELLAAAPTEGVRQQNLPLGVTYAFPGGTVLVLLRGAVARVASVGPEPVAVYDLMSLTPPTPV